MKFLLLSSLLALSLVIAFDPYANDKGPTYSAKIPDNLPSAKLKGPRPPGTLLLNMLIKNEEDHLRRTLPKWAKVIDYWIIGVDDHNTDKSPEIIREILGHIPGHIEIVAFDGMGPTWTILVERGLELFPEATHGIMADADFSPMLDKLDKMELDIRCSKHMYEIWTEDRQNHRRMDWIYRNVPGVSVKRRTHQTIEAPPLPDQEVFQTLINLPIEERPGGYQDRSGKKNERYIGFLEADLLDYPNDTRTLYYLGYAHFAMFNDAAEKKEEHWDALATALKWFNQRLDQEGGNLEERWFTVLKVAEIYERFYKDQEKARELYQQATEMDPDRADAFFYLGQNYRLQMRMAEALPWLREGAKKSFPERSLFHWQYLYECLVKLEFGRTVKQMGDDASKEEIKEAIYFNKVAMCEGQDASEKSNNLVYFKGQLKKLKKKSKKMTKAKAIKKLLNFLNNNFDTLEAELGDYETDSTDGRGEPLTLFEEMMQQTRQLVEFRDEYSMLPKGEKKEWATCRRYRRATGKILAWYRKNNSVITEALDTDIETKLDSAMLKLREFCY